MNKAFRRKSICNENFAGTRSLCLYPSRNHVFFFPADGSEGGGSPAGESGKRGIERIFLSLFLA